MFSCLNKDLTWDISFGWYKNETKFMAGLSGFHWDGFHSQHWHKDSPRFIGKIKCNFYYGGFQSSHPHFYIHNDGKLTVSLHMMLGRTLSRFSCGVIGDKDNFREKSTKFHVMWGTIFRYSASLDILKGYLQMPILFVTVEKKKTIRSACLPSEMLKGTITSL